MWNAAPLFAGGMPLVPTVRPASTSPTDAAAAELGFALASRKKYGDTVVDILRRA